ncbi:MULTISPECIES: hypothetical protein [Xenorhabdus]|uniref:hypothetical protein n=1 Tax=Xenorhabdus TaxID=626 RepID=UPI000B216ED4|nr:MULTISPECIES: hypothetical protein [Xenorhabdus]
MKEINKDMMSIISGAGSEQAVKPVKDLAPTLRSGNWPTKFPPFVVKPPAPPKN